MCSCQSTDSSPRQPCRAHRSTAGPPLAPCRRHSDAIMSSCCPASMTERRQDVASLGRRPLQRRRGSCGHSSGRRRAGNAGGSGGRGARGASAPGMPRRPMRPRASICTPACGRPPGWSGPHHCPTQSGIQPSRDASSPNQTASGAESSIRATPTGGVPQRSHASRAATWPTVTSVASRIRRATSASTCARHVRHLPDSRQPRTSRSGRRRVEEHTAIRKYFCLPACRSVMHLSGANRSHAAGASAVSLATVASAQTIATSSGGRETRVVRIFLTSSQNAQCARYFIVYDIW